MGSRKVPSQKGSWIIAWIIGHPNYHQFTLPDTVDGNKISAKVKQGVLTIHIPKAQNAQHQRKIKVEEEG